MSSVRDFGAAGDGKLDDTDAIQHALKDSDGLVEFPPGDYRITRTIQIDLAKTHRISLQGLGTNAKIIMAGRGPAFSFLGSHGKSAAPKDFAEIVWQRERMPLVSNIEITGEHPEADGIRLEGVMQPTITGVLIRQVRNAIHIANRSRNVLISHCHIYHNTGIGIFLDHCNLHQTIITGSHISYCRLGGIRIQGGEIRNLQITGNDIEYNNRNGLVIPPNSAPFTDAPTAEIYIDCEEGSIREGTIASNTIQATYSPGGCNIRFIGSGDKGNHRVGMWTIAGNLIGSQAINIHLTSALGFAISGNYIYSGHNRNILVENSRSIALGTNTLGHNPDYGDKELCTGIRFVDSEDCSITGLIIQDALAGQNTVVGAIQSEKEALVEIVRCRRMNLSGNQILEGTPVGLLLEDCHDTVVTGCSILDQRNPSPMKHPLVWRDAENKPSHGNLLASCRIAGTAQLPVSATVTQANLVRD
ncbi:MAG: right-handed parallel beta-helix repeat-containing protein [Planctomycetaceae bacterium]